MFTLSYSEEFEKDLKRLKDKALTNQIIRKTLELERRTPVGKRLTGHPYWSIHVGKYRVIYEIIGKNVKIYRLLERKFNYRELRWSE